jgi:putative ABC transport system permease protein
MFTEALHTDLRRSFRSIIRDPGMSLLIVMTLGLAMGANIAVFALLDKLILRPLPVERPGELVIVSAPPIQMAGPSFSVGGRGPGGKMVMGISYPLYAELRDGVTVFRGMAAHYRVRSSMLAGTEAIQAKGVLTTGNYFELLGVKAFLGRTLIPDDDRVPSGSPVVVLTHGFWQRQFGGDPSMLHRTIRLNQQPMTIVGVTAPGFTGTVAGDVPDFFAPLSMGGAFNRTPGFRYDAPGFHLYTVMARLAPGVDMQQAERIVDQVYQQLLAEAVRQAPSLTAKDRSIIGSQHAELSPGGYASSQQSSLSRDLRTPLTLLMAMVGLVLVVAAGNVANLLLARGTARARDTAIRFYLGSTRWRMLRERLMESLLLSSAAAAVGLLLAYWTARLAPVALNVESLPPGVSSAPDYRAGAAAIGLAWITGLGIWGASALRPTRRSTLPALMEDAAIGGHPSAMFWRRGMVISQIALSLVLLCAAVVLSRSLMKLMAVDPGFPTDNLYSFALHPGQAGYENARAGAYLAQVLEAAESLPGVRFASLTTHLPLSGGGSATWVIGEQAQGRDEQGILTDITLVGPAYFKVLEMPLRTGREFTPEDDAGGTKVAVLNESLARLLFGSSDPIGRRIAFQGQQPDIQVVGVVKDIKARALRAPISPGLFMPLSQQPVVGSITIVLRTSGPGISHDIMRTAMKRIDPTVPVTEFGSLAGRISQSLYRDRMMATLSIGFASLAALLCALGIFGLTSFSVTRRAKEIGVRLSLGATQPAIYKLMLKEVALITAAGCAIGVGAFMASSRILSSMLFELASSDPPSLILATVVLAGITFLAGFLPARRAAALDPARTLRQD